MGQRWKIGYAKVSSATNFVNGTNLAILASSREPPRIRCFINHLNYTQKGHTVWYVLLWWAEVDSNLKEKRGIPLFSRLLAITTHQQPKVELFIFVLFFDYFRQTKNLSPPHRWIGFFVSLTVNFYTTKSLLFFMFIVDFHFF